MNKISCGICMDLIPLVKDEVSSEESKKAVFEHIKSCESCRNLYGEEIDFGNSDKVIIGKIKKNLTKIFLAIITLAILFGVSLSANQFMFYNILIMPIIGAVSYFALKKKCIYVCIAVFVTVYLRWLIYGFDNIISGNLVQALVSPLSWSIIYLALTLFGVLVSILLHFGFRKEQKHEKDS